MQEIFYAYDLLKTCPKCNFRDFWVGLKRDRPYVQCKGCGAKFELYEVYATKEKDKVNKRLRFFRK